jgi:RHS repeat-associated protein
LDAQGNSFTTGLVNFKARMFDPMLGRFIQPDTLTPGGPQGLNRYSYSINNPINYNDPSGHMACDDEYGCGPFAPPEKKPIPTFPTDPTCAQGTKRGSYKGDPSENPKVSDQDVQAMAVFMFYEYSGYYLYNGDRSNIPWDIVIAKFWVFYNLIFSRRDYINHGVGIYNSSAERIATWSPYIAVAGHEAPLKAALINILPGGFSTTSYDEQYLQILNEAARLNKDPVYLKMLDIALGVRDKWNQYGTGSSADLSYGSVSFADYAINNPTGGSQWVCTTHSFLFEPGIWGYSILDDIDR